LLRRIAAAAHPSQVSRHGSLGYSEAQLLDFAVDPRRSPRRILGGHALNEIPHFFSDSRPATSRTGAPAPLEAKTGTMPAGYRFRFHDNENLAPVRPETPKPRPEQAVHGMEKWPGAFSLEDSDLLTKGENFKRRIGPAAEEDANGSEDCENAVSHEKTVVTERRVGDRLARLRDRNH